MPIFQSTVVTKHLNAQNNENITAKWNIYKDHFLNPTIQENIRNSNEEQYQGGFIIDLFVNVLGYTKNPTPNFNITTEYKNVKDSKKADGAILVNEVVKAVIELKGTETTDLSKVESQAFGYKNNQSECTYVITSNFEKLRFYIDNAIEHIEFNLFTLSKAEFNLLYLCLGYENIAKDIPKKIKDESLSQEDAITKKLYHDYSLFRNEIFHNILKNNPEYDKLILFKKTQKLLDRFLFLFFAEDRHLLPANSVRLILSDWNELKERDAYKPLYDRFKKYFGYLNTGFKGKRYNVFAYNGGLFKTDEVLDAIVIDDNLLYKHTLILSEYDFESEVSVNVLGHIFEHSLTEIEDIQNEILGIETDKGKSKRKKEGVYYTPKYITKYIVDNTIGELCKEKKAELNIIEEDYEKERKGRKKTILKALIENLDDYYNWLLKLTICDPACGSGAFLNQALDFLIAEHRYIDELRAKLLNVPMSIGNIENSILENNLFGVDINEEGIEIAKLSLWLHTAEKGRKLTTLNNNIKCGNSLIDDPEIAGDKAFNWQEEFPKVFEKGGFDVIIGNPPYVRVEFISENEVEYYKEKYLAASSKFDLSSLFFEKSIGLLNYEGVFSIITSYQFIYASSGIGLRKFISKNTETSVIMFSSDSQVFQGATTYAGIFISKKGKGKYVNILKANNVLNQVNITEHFNITSSNFSSSKVIVADTSLLDKLDTNPSVVRGRVIGMAKTGVVTSADEVFYINQELVKEYNLEYELIYPIIGSSELERWNLLIPETLCIYPYKEVDGKTTLIPFDDLSKNFSGISSYLLRKKDILIKRSQGRKNYSGSERWYQLNRPREKWIYDSQKIIYPGTTNKPKFALDSKGQLFRNARVYAYLLTSEFGSYYHAILPILNSSFCKYLITLKCAPKANNYYEMSTGFMDDFPFILPKDDSKDDFQKISKFVIFLSIKLYELSQKFQRTLQRKFALKTLSKKLEDWYLLSFTDFVKELKKKKIKLSLSEEAEWEDYFLVEQQKALELKAKIDTTDKEIDQMVYELYGLTEEEIEIVENS